MVAAMSALLLPLTLSALLEPGDTGLQEIRLSHPVLLGEPVDGPVRRKSSR